MRYIGGNIYLWGEAAQNRLLLECLGPTACELVDEGVARGFWFDRFNARGPHIFFFICLSNEAFNGAARARLTDRLQAFLAEQPSRERIPVDRLEELHRQMHGKALCPADKWPGFEENNSFLLFEHSPTGYPFLLTSHLQDAAEFWRLLSGLSFWTIQQIEDKRCRSPANSGIRWAAALDGALQRIGAAESYWRYHATTLIMGLAERLAVAEHEVRTSLFTLIGLKNRETFSRLWNQVETSGPPWPLIPELVKASLSSDDTSRRFLALREAVHCTWKQLGLASTQHIPLVLFAWNRSLRP